jgi:hypothetical protein
MKLRSWVSIVGMAVSGIVAGGSLDRAAAVTTVIYDGTSGVLPNAQTPNYLNFISKGGGVQTAGANLTNFNTFTPSLPLPINTPTELVYAGYANYEDNKSLTSPAFTTLVNPLFPLLDRTAGYTLSFTMRINSQTNNGTNGLYRAGFSAIVLGNDNRGIEIGFRNPNTKNGGTTPDIFSQNNASFNSMGEQNTSIGTILSNLTTYDLNILNNTYTLKTGGTQLLTGALRDYTAAVGVSNSYTNPNFLFFGDATTSAGANFDLQNITLTTNDPTAVPEPTSMLGSVLAIGFGATLKRKLDQTNRSITKLLK